MAAVNHRCWSEQWFGTMSMMILRSVARARRDQRLGLGQGAEYRVDVAVVGHVVAAVGHRRYVPGREPDRVRHRGRVGTAGGWPGRPGRRCRHRCRRRSCAGRPGRRPQRVRCQARRPSGPAMRAMAWSATLAVRAGAVPGLAAAWRVLPAAAPGRPAAMSSRRSFGPRGPCTAMSTTSIRTTSPASRVAGVREVLRRLRPVAAELVTDDGQGGRPDGRADHVEDSNRQHRHLHEARRPGRRKHGPVARPWRRRPTRRPGRRRTARRARRPFSSSAGTCGTARPYAGPPRRPRP